MEVTIILWTVFSVMAILLAAFIWVPMIKKRMKLMDDVSNFLESHTKDDEDL